MKSYIIKVDGISYNVEVEELAAGAAPVPQAPAGRPAGQHPQSVVAPAPAAPCNQTQLPGKTAPQNSSGITVKAPMPGTILSVAAAEGQLVTAGEVLLILEAMKMENEILAPADGRVSSVSASKGVQVNAGDVLVMME